MEQFRGLTLDTIGALYKNNNLLLCSHLMEAGLLKNEADCDKCKHKMVLFIACGYVWTHFLCLL